MKQLDPLARIALSAAARMPGAPVPEWVGGKLQDAIAGIVHLELEDVSDGHAAVGFEDGSRCAQPLALNSFSHYASYVFHL